MVQHLIDNLFLIGISMVFNAAVTVLGFIRPAGANSKSLNTLGQASPAMPDAAAAVARTFR